jgi:hypothetical protein
MSSFTLPARRRMLLAATGAALSLALTACGSTPSGDGSMPGMPGMPSAARPTTPAPVSAMPSTGDMDGMGAVPTGNGLAATSNGYTLNSTTTVPLTTGYRFTITDPDGKPVTSFTLEQTKRLHFYAIRSDLTGFQHIHPTMAPDGTWTAPLAALTPGNWRMFATFTPATGPGQGTDFVLSRTLTVPGSTTPTPLPPAAASTTVDGYTATVDGYTATVTGDLMAGMPHPLTITITRHGEPVTDLQPYLDTYGHLTAFHEGDQAFAHLHPTTAVTGDHGGPTLSFHTELPTTGNWRLFLQFRTGGVLHTAQLTLRVN